MIPTNETDLPEEHKGDLASRFPTAYTILFGLIVLMAALTWVIPAGQYQRETNESVGREVAILDTRDGTQHLGAP